MSHGALQATSQLMTLARATANERSDQSDAEDTAALELRALERMITARCRQVRQLAENASSNEDGESREDDLQLQAFVERSEQALEEIETDTGEPCEIRIARLEGLVQALECSWDYFRTEEPGSDGSEEAADWEVLVK